LDKKKIL